MAWKMKSIEPGESLHNIMEQIQLRFMEDQAKQIIADLPQYLAATIAASPVRSRPYKLDRSDAVRPLKTAQRSKDMWQEKHWEEACYHHWAKSDTGLADTIPFRLLVSYQVMLRDTNKDKCWGEVDLLGASRDNLPVVVELKSKPSEYLLRAVAEGVAYAIAIKKAWQQGNLRNEWEERLHISKCQLELSTVPIAIAAPENCWKEWLVQSDAPKPFQVSMGARTAITDLCSRLKNHGFPVFFVRIYGGGSIDANGLPVVEKADEVML